MPADKFYPDAKEPHIHEHKGGVDFTNVGHNHKFLQRGDKINKNVCKEVVADLKEAGGDREKKIAKWIEDNLL